MDTAAFYKSRAHLPDWQAANWGSRESQELRWDILREVVPADFAGDVLDVGCGPTKRFGLWWPEYTGIDLADGQDALEHEGAYDVVVASGVFGLNGSNVGTHKLIRKMWGLCGVGVAFNTLSTLAPVRDPGLFYLDPVETFKFCLQITRNVVVRHDYLPHDFTVYLYR